MTSATVRSKEDAVSLTIMQDIYGILASEEQQHSMKAQHWQGHQQQLARLQKLWQLLCRHRKLQGFCLGRKPLSRNFINKTGGL